MKYTAVDRSGVDELSDRLAGQVIVVEPGPDKSDLEKIALGHGATVEQNAVKGRTTKYITVRIVGHIVSLTSLFMILLCGIEL